MSNVGNDALPDAGQLSELDENPQDTIYHTAAEVVRYVYQCLHCGCTDTEACRQVDCG